jgi:hypothetical protein
MRRESACREKEYVQRGTDREEEQRQRRRKKGMSEEAEATRKIEGGKKREIKEYNGNKRGKNEGRED